MPDSTTQTVTKKFAKQIDSLAAICEFTTVFIGRNSIPRSHAYTIHLALEEIFTNMVKYSTASANDVSISLEMSKSQVVMKLIDYDVAEFDIRNAGKVDTNRPAKDTKVGGLGIHLVKQLIDQIDYDYTDRNSAVTLTLNIGSKNA